MKVGKEKIVVLFIIFGLMTVVSCSLITNLINDEDSLPNYGAFLKGETGVEEIPFSEGMPSLEQGIPETTNPHPKVLLWNPETNLTYLVLQGYGSPEGPFEYRATPLEEGVLEISPINALQPGVYCFVQGSPLGSPGSLPTWCFRILDSVEGQEETSREATEAPPTEVPNLFLMRQPISREADAFAWNSDETRIAFAGSFENDIQQYSAGVYSLDTGTFEIFSSTPGKYVDIEWNPTGDQIALGIAHPSFKNDVVIYQVQDSIDEIIILDPDPQGSSPTLTDLEWSPQGSKLAIATARIVRVVDTTTWEEITRYELDSSLPAGIRSLAWNSDGNTLAIGGLNGLVAIWDPATEKFANENSIEGLLDDNDHVVEVDWQPNSLIVAAGSSHGNIFLLNGITGAINSQFDTEVTGMNGLDWHPTEEIIAFASSSRNTGSVIQLMTPEGTIITSVDIQGTITDLSWSESGTLLGVSTSDASFYILEYQGQ